ncbi:MAG: deoxyribonuclease IV [Chloroflexota bacterium]
MSVCMLGAHMSISGGVSHALDRASSIGSNAVQVFTKNNRQWKLPPLNPEDVQRWNEELPKQGIDYAVSHASYLINLASPKEEQWEKSCVTHKAELQNAYGYGINHVVMHPGSHTKSSEAAGIQRIADGLNRIHTETPECAKTLTLLELMAGAGSIIGYTFAQLQQIIELVDDQSRVGVCVDTCHAYAAGYDIRTRAGYNEMMAELIDVISLERVRCWHFNDSKGKLGSRVDRHIHIGEGEIGSDAFGFILNDPRWDGIAMLLETPKKEDLADDVRNLKTLCSLISDPDRVPIGLRDA